MHGLLKALIYFNRLIGYLLWLVVKSGHKGLYFKCKQTKEANRLSCFADAEDDLDEVDVESHDGLQHEVESLRLESSAQPDDETTMKEV